MGVIREKLDKTDDVRLKSIHKAIFECDPLVWGEKGWKEFWNIEYQITMEDWAMAVDSEIHRRGLQEPKPVHFSDLAKETAGELMNLNFFENISAEQYMREFDRFAKIIDLCLKDIREQAKLLAYGTQDKIKDELERDRAISAIWQALK